MPTLVVDRLTVTYRSGDYDVRPLDGFSMQAQDGELVLLLGPSGCG
jgi:putative ABC transport system ATP-binding protein